MPESFPGLFAIVFAVFALAVSLRAKSKSRDIIVVHKGKRIRKLIMPEEEYYALPCLDYERLRDTLGESAVYTEARGELASTFNTPFFGCLHDDQDDVLETLLEIIQTHAKDPERDLRKLIPEEEWVDARNLYGLDDLKKCSGNFSKPSRQKTRLYLMLVYMLESERSRHC